MEQKIKGIVGYNESTGTVVLNSDMPTQEIKKLLRVVLVAMDQNDNAHQFNINNNNNARGL